MTDEPSVPTVFISYSHDSPEHKRWVLEFAGKLRANGVEVISDFWDTRPGDDLLRFMERSVTKANRVLLICTETYVKKANDGVGGAGYEAMIVGGELIKDQGQAKFVPIIRQSGTAHVPTSLSTRKYVNLSEGVAEAESNFNELVNDLHNILPVKPPLGKPPTAGSRSVASWDTVAIDTPSEAAALLVAPAEFVRLPTDPLSLFKLARAAALEDDLMQWRRVVSVGRKAIAPTLAQWWEKYGSLQPTTTDELIAQTMEGVAAFSPLTAVALGGIASGNEKYESQVGLIDDVLNFSQWQRSGLVARVELPESGALVYQALNGAMCLNLENVKAAMRIALADIPSRYQNEKLPLWQHKNVIAWPESFGKNLAQGWGVLKSLPERWMWVAEVFNDGADYQAALYAYYVALSTLEFVTVMSRGDLHQAPDVRFNIPPVFELTDAPIKQRGLHLLKGAALQLKGLWLASGLSEQTLRAKWPEWVGINDHWYHTLAPFNGSVAFGSLLPEVLAAAAPSSRQGVAERVVEFDYPTQSGIQQALEARGFTLGWVRPERVAGIELQGGEVVVELDARGTPATFKTSDGMVLVRRPKLP
jgi:hypothetical protein